MCKRKQPPVSEQVAGCAQLPQHVLIPVASVRCRPTLAVMPSGNGRNVLCASLPHSELGLVAKVARPSLTQQDTRAAHPPHRTTQTLGTLSCMPPGWWLQPAVAPTSKAEACSVCMEWDRLHPGGRAQTACMAEHVVTSSLDERPRASLCVCPGAHVRLCTRLCIRTWAPHSSQQVYPASHRLIRRCCARPGSLEGQMTDCVSLLLPGCRFTLRRAVGRTGAHGPAVAVYASGIMVCAAGSCDDLWEHSCKALARDVHARGRPHAGSSSAAGAPPPPMVMYGMSVHSGQSPQLWEKPACVKGRPCSPHVCDSGKV